MTAEITSVTSLFEGQISFRYIGLFFSSYPRGSVSRFIRTEPTIAYATTRGGEAK